jgi:hypothetical protein
MLGTSPRHFPVPSTFFLLFPCWGADGARPISGLIYRDICGRLQVGATDSQNDRLWDDAMPIDRSGSPAEVGTHAAGGGTEFQNSPGRARRS